jgi:hypothetical protein
MIALASGCSEAPDTGIKLYTTTNERGMLTVTDELPEAPVSKGDSRVREPNEAQQVWLEEKNREFDRRLAALRESQKVREKLGQQRIETHKEILRLQEAGAYGDILRQQEERLQERQQSPDLGNLLAERRRAKLRGMQENSQAEMIQQQKAMSDSIRAESLRLQQEASQLSGSAPVPYLVP